MWSAIRNPEGISKITKTGIFLDRQNLPAPRGETLGGMGAEAPLPIIKNLQAIFLAAGIFSSLNVYLFS